MENAKDRFLASLARCRAQPEFTDDFYRALLASSDEVRQRFRFTNMQQQARMLSESLEVCATAIDGQPQGLSRLNEIGRSHDKHHHNILPEWYPLWVDAMVSTASRTDPEWTTEHDELWRRMLQLIVNRIVSRYDG